MENPDPTGKTVLIIAGEFAGEEGICLGSALNCKDRWAVSANSSDRVVELRFDEEFGVLINRGQEPGRN